MNPTQAIFLKAAEVLEKRGHAKGILENRNGSVCIAGALNVAIHGLPGWGNGEQQIKTWDLLKLVGTHCFGSYGSYGSSKVIDWNNRPETTAKEVINALKKTAGALSEKSMG